MDAVEYIKTIRRLCESQNGYSGCSGCPLLNEDDYCSIADARERAEDVVQIVEKWAKDNPIKTRQSEFLKKFPNADMQRISTLFPCVMDQTIRPTRCVKYESFSSPKKCVECRNDYWYEEVDPNGRS